MQIRHWLTLQASTQSLALHSVRHLVGRPSRGVPVTNAINAISTASTASTASTTSTTSTANKANAVNTASTASTTSTASTASTAIPIKDKQKGEEQVLQLHVATEVVTDQ